MSICDNINVEKLVVDVHSNITPSDIVIYEESLNSTLLDICVINDSYPYAFPTGSKIRVYIDDVLCDDAYVNIINEYRGQFTLSLNSDMFVNGINRQYEIIVDLYFANTLNEDEYKIQRLFKTSVFYSSGMYDGSCGVKANLFKDDSKYPSPDFDKFIQE